MDSLLTLTTAAKRLRNGTLTSVELVESALDAIARFQPRTNAFTQISADRARAAARDADVALARGSDRGPLQGLPISIKDLIDVKGEVTSAGSRVLRDRVATTDAPLITRLTAAGAILIGRTNLHEFALGTTSDDSAFGPVRHPLDETRSPGGSSGGSAVAVATGMGLASIGSDTGGSIRIPAAACGIVGLKPPFGEVPTDGVIPLSPSFDHLGPMTRSVDDALVMWAVLANRSVTALEDPAPSRLRLATLTGYFQSPVAPDVRLEFERAVDRLFTAGVTVRSAELPSAADTAEMYIRIVLREAFLWHSKYLDTRWDDYSPIVRDRLSSGQRVTKDAYAEAQTFRQTLRDEVDAALNDVDALMLPTLPIVAPRIGDSEITVDPSIGDRTPVRTAMLKHTQPFNLTGHPAISIPLRTSTLPVGLQLVGHRDDTARLLAIASACEKIVG